MISPETQIDLQQQRQIVLAEMPLAEAKFTAFKGLLLAIGQHQQGCDSSSRQDLKIISDAELTDWRMAVTLSLAGSIALYEEDSAYHGGISQVRRNQDDNLSLELIDVKGCGYNYLWSRKNVGVSVDTTAQKLVAGTATLDYTLSQNYLHTLQPTP